MCETCYKEFGSPNIINDPVRITAKAIGKVYEHNCVGGNLHIVIDDWNLDDDSIYWCIENFHRDIADTTEEEYQIEWECLHYLKKLSVAERASALALYKGFITEN